MNPKISLSKQSQSAPGAKELLSAEELRKRLNDLDKVEVLVGIPQATATRRKGPITNAQLLFIHSKGSPARNIPARPVIEPAINADGNKQAIAAQLKQAAIMKAKGNDLDMLAYLRRAGQIATNAAKAWFTDSRNNWAPNSPETIRRKGSNRPLIDTGQLRAAITFVIREVEK